MWFFTIKSIVWNPWPLPLQLSHFCKLAPTGMEWYATSVCTKYFLKQRRKMLWVFYPFYQFQIFVTSTSNDFYAWNTMYLPIWWHHDSVPNMTYFAASPDDWWHRTQLLCLEWKNKFFTTLNQEAYLTIGVCSH